jgi:non-heme chloroperoxidase
MTTKTLELPDGATIAYTDIGTGRPILLLHGVCMSRRFFDRNVDRLSDGHRVITMDFRSHGDSPPVEGGHTVAQYARDVRALLAHLEINDVTAIGWSMGSFVLWDYLAQFGNDRLASVVVVSQGPSDLTQPDWPYGIADVPQLQGFLAAMQEDFRGFFTAFAPLMFKAELPAEELTDFADAICQVGANAGSVIFVDQTLKDYRSQLATYTIPHLLVWGRDEKVIKLGSGEWLANTLANAEYVVFDDSGHCPMWEEPDRFNTLVADWISRH